MRYSIYKITNRINGKIYIGAHATKDITDNYMGSGKILKRAFAKYGKEQFDKDILHILDSEEEMYLKEKDIVDEDFILRKDTYNLKLGGEGGWSYINDNRLNQTESAILSSIKNLKKANEKNKELVKLGLHRKGFTLSDETKTKISEAGKGKRLGDENSSFGKLWLNKEGKNELVLIEKIEEYIQNGWTKGMKQNKKSRKAEKNPSFGKSWYTNGIENKLSNEEDSLDLIDLGWYKGRTFKKKV